MTTKMYRPHIFDCENRDILYKSVENLLVDMIIETTGNQGHARLALAGGSTPMPLFKALGNNPIIPWGDIEMYQVDERFVEGSDPSSNQNRIKESFGADCIAQLNNFYNFKTELPIHECVQNYNEVLDTLEDPFFDITILGIGPDGHIGSLFPGGDYLGHQEAHVVKTTTDTFEISERVSLTAESILNSQHIIVLLTGKSKMPILKEMNEGTKSIAEFPAKILLAHPNVQIFYTGE
jgi:6-phosphogluconolactonase